MAIIWSEKYELGIDVIDAQHRRIVTYVNEILDLPSTNTDTKLLNEVLENLVDYTYSHFAFEESLLEEVGYTDLALHRLTHDTFKKQVETFKMRFEKGENIVQELAEMLQSWLVEHILSDDTDYAEIVKEKMGL